MHRRNDYRGGGGYGGGGGGGYGGGGYGGGGGGYGSPRNNRGHRRRPSGGFRRRDQPPPLRPEQVLASLLFQLGDGQQDVQASLRQLVDAIEEDINQQRESLVELIIPIALKQPVKIALYAALVALLENNSQGFAAVVLARLQDLLQNAVQEWNPYQIRLMLRFLLELSRAGVVETSAFMELLQLFVSEATATEVTSPSHAARAEFCLAVVVYIVPFAGGFLKEHHADQLHALLDAVQSTVLQRKVPESFAARQRSLVAIFRNNEGQAVPGPDWLVDRWERLAATYTADGDGNWREVDCERWTELDDVILRANSAFLLQRTANVKAHSFTCPQLPAHEEGQRYEGLHRSVYRLFDSSDVEKNLKPGVRVLMEQYIMDLSIAMADCHKEAVKYMVNMPFTSVRPHFFVVETIFGMLFELPDSAHSHLYYHVLIGDAVKMDPQRIAPILGRAIDLLYNRLDQLNMDCFDRFVEWFGFHLSNFDWKWAWNDWATVLQERDNSHRRRFVSEVLEQAVNLSYLDRIARTLPESFSVLLPPKPLCNFDYLERQFAVDLQAEIKARAEPEALKKFVYGVEGIASDEERLRIVMQVFLMVGAKSCTHILKLVEKHIVLLKELTTTDDLRVEALKALLRFWGNSKQHVVILADKLMSYQVVTNTSIIKWIFSSAVEPYWKEGFVWVIMRNTLNKTIAKEQAIKKTLEDLRDGRDEDEDEVMDEEARKESIAKLEEKLAHSREEKLGVFAVLVEQFSAVLANDARLSDDFVQCRIHGHFDEVLRKYAPHIQQLSEARSESAFENCSSTTAQMAQEAAALL